MSINSLWIKVKYALALFVLFVSCTQESNVAPDVLRGKWIIFEATRNGYPDRTLERGYIDIQSIDSLQSNFLGFPNGSAYKIKGNRLSIVTHEKPIVLDVIQISKDTLNLKTDVGYGDLSLLLSREKL